MRTIMAVLAALWLYAAPAQAQEVSQPPQPQYKTVVFAGGCFWCMESDFDDTKGVVKTVSGYTGGTVDQPSYAEVSKGTTGHVEAVQVTYDPSLVSYEELLKVFWQNIDPFDNSGQFCDKGAQYRAGIFYATGEEQALAEASRSKVEEKFGKKVATIIRPAKRFWPAEEKHQDYHAKSAVSYGFYRTACGRDQTLKEIWGE